VAHEIATIFQKLDGLRQSKQPGLKIVALMKASWKYDDITRLMDKLSAYQSQLVLRMLQHLGSATKEMSEFNKERFDLLDQQCSEIKQVMAVTNNRLDGMRNHSATLRRRLDETDARGIAQHDRILSAILTLKNGETKIIAPTGAYQQGFEYQGQSLMTLSITENGAGGHAEVRGFGPIQDMVLRSLYFRHYSDRYDSVKSAYASTFKWILKAKPDIERPWPCLLQWLESGNGCYWISGKAGSGKSTLMKYLLDNPRVTETLQKWTGNSRGQTALASFFFWNLGTTMQKSQEGLLRSLLYDILCRHPGLIPSVMPELRILEADFSRGRFLEAPSFAELLRWFNRLLGQTSSQFRLFFLIDGIDEYEGDQIEVVNLLSTAHHYQYVKFLISSRPTPVCVDAFSHLPKLRLQDLTRNDIRHYTVGLLRERLESRHGDEWESLTETVVEKSCGVFLWVVLVVRSILAGLREFDDITELRNRLHDFPPELKDLYAAMFRHMPRTNRKQASELFQTCLAAAEAQNGIYHITPIQLHFAGWGATAAVEMPVKFLTIPEEESFVKTTEGRIRARCAGILELRSVDFKLQGCFRSKSIKHFYVDFIHRTAVDFLRLPEIWEEVSLLTEGSGFHPAVNLCHSCLLLCKTAWRDRPLILETSDLWYYMDRAMHYASLAERDGTPVSSAVLLELDKTMSKHWREVETCYVTQEAFDTRNKSGYEIWQLRGKSYCETKDSHWASGYGLDWDNRGLSSRDAGTPLRSCLLEAQRPLGFYSLAVFYCLYGFLQQTLPHCSMQEAQNDDLASRLLFDATENMLFTRPWSGTSEHKEGMRLACPAICSLLLEKGADPNAGFHMTKETAWGLMLEYGLVNEPRKVEFWRNYDFRGFAYTYSRLLVNFLHSGADANAVVSTKQRMGVSVMSHRLPYSTLAAVEALYCPVELDESFAFSVQSLAGPEGRSPELVSFYKHLQHLMARNGAVKELRTGPQSNNYGPPQENPNSTNTNLGRPAPPLGPGSAGFLRIRLKDMFGKWNNLKGSVAT
jgi:hypothetical protein